MPTITNHEIQLEDVPAAARPHIEAELAELTHAEKIVKRFHQYLRDETELSSGVVVDYVKAAHRMLVEDQDLQDVANSGPTIQQLKRMTALEKNTEGGTDS